jgi:hypothetical protein
VAFLGISVEMLCQPVGIAWKRAAARAAGASLTIRHVHAREASAAICAYQQAESLEAAAWDAMVAAAAGRPFVVAVEPTPGPVPPPPPKAAPAAPPPRPARRPACRPKRAPKAKRAPPAPAAGAALCVDPEGCPNAAGPRGLCSTHRHRRERDGTFEEVALPPQPGSGGRWTRRPRPPRKVVPPG